MFDRRNPRINDEQLDRLGRTLVCAAAANDDAADETAAAPFLYTRLRARIAAERTRSAHADESWLALLAISRRVVPALTAVAVLIFALMLWLASGGGGDNNGNANAEPAMLSEEAFFDAREPGVEQAVMTNANNLSRDEVLTIVVNRGEQSRQ